MDEFVREWFHEADNDILNAKNNLASDDMIRQEFIDEIHDAEKRIERGEGKSFKDRNELKKFLDDLLVEE